MKSKNQDPQVVKLDNTQKMTSGQIFAIKTKQRQKKLFLDSPIVKGVLLISLPSMMIALMTCLYTFSDQIMMANLIPRYNPFETKVGWPDYNEYVNLVSTLNAAGLDITTYTSRLVVRSAVANTAPVTVFINAITLLVANGTSVAFSKMNGKGDYPGAQKVWCIGFYANIIIALTATAILLGCCGPLTSLENGDPLKQLSKSHDQIITIVGQEGYDAIEKVYTKANDMINTYSRDFCYIIISALILSMFDSFLSLLIISEGKQVIVVIATVVSNCVNILLDFFLIYFAKLAMIGGGLATLFGWTFNCSWYFIQIWIMNRKKDTALMYSALNLKKNKIDWAIFRNIFANGLASFLRNLSMGICTWLQVFLLANVVVPGVGTGGITANQYTNYYGAVNPIYNLFFPVILGTIQGSRIMCSYLYGCEHWKRMRQTYWVAMLIGLIYGLFIVLLIGVALNPYMLMIFGINKNDQYANIASLMLLIALGQLPIYAFNIGGQLIYQATSRALNASICALMQGIICNIPVSAIMVGVSFATNSVNVFLFTPIITVLCSSIIIVSWTLHYMKRHFYDDVINHNVMYMQDKGYFDPSHYKSKSK